MKKELNWEDVSFILSSKYRREVLNALDKERTPSSLSKELNINKTHISRAISELVSKKMVECLTPNVSKGKLYVISEYGKKILEKVKN